ncbi:MULTISPECIES: hypothetical protein [Pseudomonas]|uniref:hypothetical protein n=1 Tax=Pseudomonas TaxID=286 RepID=UPI000590AAC4|nr:hypothetical protein [Pseudomonas massiliensis]
MAAELVAQFHARDAEGRVYPVHEFQEASVLANDGHAQGPLVTYRLAIGDRVNYLGDNRFMLVQSGIEIVRIP